MSLIDSMMTDCCRVTVTRTADGAGGYTAEYSDGDTFGAAIVLDTSAEARIAEQSGFSNVYTITTQKDTVLDFHDIIKRKADGKLFRVTSDAYDKSTPACSSLNMRQCTAERWEQTT